MNKLINYVESIDWERESYTDAIFQLEREKDLEISWQKYEQEHKPVKIEYEIFHRTKSFRRVIKKLELLRPRVSIETNRRKIRTYRTTRRKFKI